MGRLFDERDTLVRLVLLVLSGLSYLLFGMHDGQPSAAQWWLAVTAFAAVLALHRLPLPSLVVQTALLGAAFAVLDDPTVNQVGASWALLELVMSSRAPAALWPAVALLTGVHVADGAAGWPGALADTALGIGTAVGLPVLSGLLVRSSRELERQAGRQAEEERRRRESEARVAVARERGAIARELHDVVAHHVASMVLRVGVAQHVLPGVDPRVAEVFDDLHATGTAALTDLRRLVALLRDPDGARPDAATAAIEADALPQALRAAVDTARRAGLTVETVIAPETGALDAVRGLAVLRLTQEALTNVAKHAGPTARARLTISVADGDVHVEVTDEGRPDGGPGGHPADRLTGGGHGLTGMRERVELFGGRFEAGPAGGGWRVAAVLPAVPAGESGGAA
ncbi:sensor histidine kinase [Planobispora longispora]|nr:histidine kinase [Planobispora longispora]